MTDPVLAAYERRARDRDDAAASLQRTADRVVQLRLALFLSSLALGLLAERRSATSLAILAIALFIAFLVAVSWHRRLRARITDLEELASLSREGSARVTGDWSRLPTRTAPATAARHAYAGDLDLYGEASLTQLLGPHGSRASAAILDDWLLRAAAVGEIEARQDAVRELAALVDWREQLALQARRTRDVKLAHLEQFIAWAEAPVQAPSWSALNVLPFLLPLLIWVPLVIEVWIPLPPFWILGVLATLAAAATTARVAHQEISRAFAREALFEHFPQLFGACLEPPLGSGYARALQQRLDHAPTHIARLRSIMSFADARYSNLYPVLQLGLLWDLHVLRVLLQWKREWGGHVRDWVRAAAELEAMAVLGTVAHDHPDWSFPTIDPALDRITATDLGHPLIPRTARVCNDVTVGPPGSFLLVTGSNMSGKSTLLRAIGLNAVLAQVGAPCCARSLTMPPLAIGSSIRVQDSLSRGVSYFMAELERLKEVVDAAESQRGHFLFLLDEILHGTNSAERRIAARHVIAHLVATGAIGAVTTHDLDLAVSQDLGQSAVPVHFTEQFTRADDGTERMTFDYTLRPGLAPSTNALKLMALVGLRTDG